jgi:hypothetical protein
VASLVSQLLCAATRPRYDEPGKRGKIVAVSGCKVRTVLAKTKASDWPGNLGATGSRPAERGGGARALRNSPFVDDFLGHRCGRQPVSSTVVNLAPRVSCLLQHRAVRCCCNSSLCCNDSFLGFAGRVDFKAFMSLALLLPNSSNGSSWARASSSAWEDAQA